MKARSFFSIIIAALVAAMTIASCTKTPDSGITVSPESLSFSNAASSRTVTVSTEGKWSASVDKDWVRLDPAKAEYEAWNGSVNIAVDKNTSTSARTAVVTFKAGSNSFNVSVSQEAGEPEPEPGTDPEPEEGTKVYVNDFDKTPSEKINDYWPYLSQSDCWKNESGSGAAGVKYAYADKMTVRNNSNSNGSYSVYAGSGVNNLFFGADPYFTIKNISVSGLGSLKLSFGAEKYLNTGDSMFSHEEFRVYISNDGKKWVSLDYVFASGDQDGKWDLAETCFTLPEGTSAIDICFKASVGSAYRLDDVSLVTTSESGAAIDFSKGVVLDGTGTESGEGSGEGTAASPYDVSRARYLIATGTNSAENVYVKGVVSHISDIAATEVAEFGNATYYISEDGTMENEFYVYHGLDLNGEKFKKMDDLKVGTKVVICGKLVNYNNVYEITSDSYLVEKDETAAVKADPAKSAHAKWLELPATSEDDGLYYVNHTMNIGGTATRNYSYYYDTDNMLAAWVAYPLSKWNRGTSTSRTDVWGYDPLMPASWQPTLFKAFQAGEGDRGDRGHQIPSADRYANYSANAQTFYYTNMTPQINAFNSYIWGKLEGSVRDWSNKCDTLYVVTGCVYADSKSYNLDNYGKKVTTPTGYFKTVLRKNGDSYAACSVYLDHKAYSNSAFVKEDVLSVDELEEKTGIDFFVNLIDIVGAEKAAAIEAADPTADSFWGIN